MAKQKSHTLLVVDDERPIVDSLQALFRREYNVFTATSALEGLEILSREKVHVVLSDQRMPEINGTEFLIRVREKYPDTIRLLVTGYADIEAVIGAVNFGQIYGYISKPWKPDEIELLVRQAVRHLEVIEENRLLTTQLQQANQLLEAKVAERTRELSDLEQYKECIIQSLQSGLIVIDMEGRCDTMNPAAGRILALAPEECTGRKLTDIPKLSFFHDPFCRTLSEGRLEYQELSIPAPDEETQYIGYGTSLMLLKSGEKRGVITIFRDTTEKRRFEEQLMQSEKLAAIGELAGGVAHEINNPLGVILGFTQLLLKQEFPDASVKKKLKHIETQTFRCKNIVSNLLRFARKSKADVAKVNVSQILHETLDILHRQLEVENIEVVRQIGVEPVQVQGNENELQQVFFNLIVNAKDAMEGGGKLTVKVWSEAGRARIVVGDNGKGIPPAIIDKIWNPFYTTKAPGKGTGLGLSITRRLVERMQGTIDVESTVGVGTRFLITMPLPVGDETVEPRVVVQSDYPPLKGLSILVVDDEEDILRLCGDLLRAENSVDMIPDPREVKDLLATKRYDLLLLDVMMPNINGLELLGQIRQMLPAQRLPVVIITGGSSDDVISKQRELGILDVLFKPFTVGELEESLRRLWERHKTLCAAVPDGQTNP